MKQHISAVGGWRTARQISLESDKHTGKFSMSFRALFPGKWARQSGVGVQCWRSVTSVSAPPAPTALCLSQKGTCLSTSKWGSVCQSNNERSDSNKGLWWRSDFEEFGDHMPIEHMIVSYETAVTGQQQKPTVREWGGQLANMGSISSEPASGRSSQDPGSHLPTRTKSLALFPWPLPACRVP